MARITIDLNTDDERDCKMLVAVSRVASPTAEAVTAAWNAEEDEGERPLARHTQDAETPAPAPRKRRTKAEMAADAQAAEQNKPSSASATNASSDSAGETPGPNGSSEPSEASVTLDQVNDRIRDLMTSGTPALKLQELVKAATDGQYGSPNKAFAEGGQEALDAIWAGLEALNG